MPFLRSGEAIRAVLRTATPRSKMTLNSVGNFSYVAQGPRGTQKASSPTQKREKRRETARRGAAPDNESVAEAERQGG